MHRNNIGCEIAQKEESNRDYLLDYFIDELYKSSIEKSH